jgi:hypothetical protein
MVEASKKNWRFEVNLSLGTIYSPRLPGEGLGCVVKKDDFLEFKIGV